MPAVLPLAQGVKGVCLPEETGEVMQEHLIDPATIPDDPFACPSKLAPKRHRFTREECQRGGKVAASGPGFSQIQQKGLQRYIDLYAEESLHIVCRHSKKRRARSGGG